MFEKKSRTSFVSTNKWASCIEVPIIHEIVGLQYQNKMVLGPQIPALNDPWAFVDRSWARLISYRLKNNLSMYHV